MYINNYLKSNIIGFWLWWSDSTSFPMYGLFLVVELGEGMGGLCTQRLKGILNNDVGRSAVVPCALLQHRNPYLQKHSAHLIKKCLHF